MAQEFVNLLEINNGVVLGNRLYVERLQAEAAFIDTINEHEGRKISKETEDDYLSDGLYVEGTYRLEYSCPIFIGPDGG